MSIITRLKQFISSQGEQAIARDIWSRHSFTPVTNWLLAYQMWKAKYLDIARARIEHAINNKPNRLL